MSNIETESQSKSYTELHVISGIINDPRKIGKNFCDYYQAIFNRAQFDFYNVKNILVGNSLSIEHAIINLHIPFTDQEIFKALNDIIAEKSLRMDCFKAKFFTYQYLI